MSLAAIRKKYQKFQSRIITYRSYRHFLNEKFRENLLHNLSKVNLVNDVDGSQKFCNIGLETVNKHEPCKQTYVRSIQMPFSLRNFLRQLWQDLDCGTTTLKIEMTRTGFCTQTK